MYFFFMKRILKGSQYPTIECSFENKITDVHLSATFSKFYKKYSLDILIQKSFFDNENKHFVGRVS